MLEGAQAGGIGALGGQHPAQRVGVGLPIAVGGLGRQRAAQERQQAGEPGYAPTVSVATQQVGGRVEIRVRDNGTGIPAAVQAKIFQPFFTTKPTGEGTGLGLSLSYDIIAKAHGGTLTVESQEGQGTTFLIRLPA